MTEAWLQSLADLVLEDTEGTPHRIGDFWEKRGAVLGFLRHYG